LCTGTVNLDRVQQGDVAPAKLFPRRNGRKFGNQVRACGELHGSKVVRVYAIRFDHALEEL
jgi:hypothetical protein